MQTKNSAESFRSGRHDTRREVRNHQTGFATTSTGKGFRSARVSVRARERSLVAFVRRTTPPQTFRVYAPVGLYLSPWLRDLDFLCFTVRLRRRNAAACNIVKPQESIARGTTERSIHRVGTERGSFAIDRSSSSSSCDLRARASIHVRFPSVQRPSFATEGSLPLRLSRAIQKFSIPFGKSYDNERCQIRPHAKIIVIRRVTTSSTLTMPKSFIKDRLERSSFQRLNICIYVSFFLEIKFHEISFEVEETYISFN